MAKAKASPKKKMREEFEIEAERSQFNVLTAANPNYFGNLTAVEYEPVLEDWKPNVKYEELTCVGYNPKSQMLEATIQVKLPYGYGGDVCNGAPGSTEYVRFFINYGSGWHDLGLSAVSVHDIPNSADCKGANTKPLTYVVTLPVDPEQDWCNNPVMPLIRGILSWNKMPGVNPLEPPVWGNVLDRYVQVEPREPYYIDVVDTLFEKVKLPDDYKLPKMVEEAKFEKIPLPDPPPLKIGELAAKYQQVHMGKKAQAAEYKAPPPHRFGAKDLEAAVSPHTLAQEAQLSKMVEWKEAGLDWQEAVQAYVKTKGDVSFEELNCLGLDCSRDWLVATFVVKLPNGYSGDLCDDGSREYITFWEDFDNKCRWNLLDTVYVDVFDIASIPPEGLHYTVVLPVDLSGFRQPCEEGHKIGRIRAVLSWSSKPSETDPNKLPTWGNRVDAHVQIKPEGNLVGDLAAIGGVGVQNINTTGNGMTKANAKFAFYDLVCDPYDNSRECAFGRRVQFHGVPEAGSKYKITVREAFGSATTVLKTPIWVTNSVGFSQYHYPVGDYFDTLSQTANIGSLLAVWDSHKEKPEDQNVLWEAQMEIVPSVGPSYTTPWYRVRLDNTSPKAEIHIDGGGDCKDFVKGDPINGKFVARDIHFGHYNLRTVPISQGPPNPNPSSGTSQTATAPGDPWSLATGSMNPCGYVVELRVYDNTIWGSVPYQHNSAYDDVGFCLRKS